MPEYKPFNDRRQIMQHASALMDEIDFLRLQIKPHDTGHIYTAISVLQGRVEKLLEEIQT